MIIKTLTIENFRSYYGKNEFVFQDGLNLILGDNGDGKSTFFDAVEWLFNTGSGNRADYTHISKKLISKLSVGESSRVRVSMSFDHDGKKDIEKTFIVTKSPNKIEMTEYKFSGTIEYDNGDKKPINGVTLLEDYCGFKHTLRRYCLFRGENDINIFDQKSGESDTALKNLVELFSQVKNFDPYLAVTQNCVSKSERAKERAISADKKNEKQETILRNKKDSLNRKVSVISEELKVAKKEFETYSQKIDNLISDKASRELIRQIKKKMEVLEGDKYTKKNMLKENYSIRLLDNYWILCGVQPIIQDALSIIAQNEKQKRELEQQHIVDYTEKKTKEKITKGFTELPWYMPNEETMKEMLDERVCKVCGTPAPEGSDAYNFMKRRFDEYLEHQAKKNNMTSDEIPPLFKNDYLDDLNKFAVKMDLGRMDVLNVDDIAGYISVNDAIKKEIAKIEDGIAKLQAEKERIIGQSALKNEFAILDEDENFRVWSSKKDESYANILKYELQLREAKDEESKAIADYDQLAKGNTAKSRVLAHKVLELINLSFEKAKQKNIDDFLNMLESKANEYLAKLNIDNFTGVIRFIRKSEYVNVILEDKSGSIVAKPNQSLEITKNMSVLFAISELTKIKRDDDYPLIFDAPTSSFGDGKEKDFYTTVSKLKKQCVILTKSFLKRDAVSGEIVVQTSELDAFPCTSYRIKQMKKGLLKDDLSTIRTEVIKIK